MRKNTQEIRFFQVFFTDLCGIPLFMDTVFTVAVTFYFGLVGMMQRSDLIGAKVTVDSAAGEGTQVSIIKLSEKK